MSDERTDVRDGEKEVTGADWILPAAAVSFAVYYLISIKDLRWEAKVSGLFVACALALLILVFAVRTGLGLAQGRLRVGFSDFNAGGGALLRQITFVVFIVAFINLIQYLGFTLSVFSFLAASFILVASFAPRRALVLAGIIALCGYLLFIVALQTPFPLGPFERLLMPLVARIG